MEITPIKYVKKEFAQLEDMSHDDWSRKMQEFATLNKKRFEVDCIDNLLFIFDENGKQLHQTDVTFCRMTFNGVVQDLRSEHQR